MSSWSRQLMTFPRSHMLGCDTASGWRKQGQPGWQHWRSLPLRAQLQAGDLQVFFHSVSTLNPAALQLVINTITPTPVQHGFFAAFHRGESDLGISFGGIRPPNSHVTKGEGWMIYECCFPRAHYTSLLSVQHPPKGPFLLQSKFFGYCWRQLLSWPWGPRHCRNQKDAIKTLCYFGLKKTAICSSTESNIKIWKSCLVTFVTFLLLAQDRN